MHRPAPGPQIPEPPRLPIDNVDATDPPSDDEFFADVDFADAPSPIDRDSALNGSQH